VFRVRSVLTALGVAPLGLVVACAAVPPETGIGPARLGAACGTGGVLRPAGRVRAVSPYATTALDEKVFANPRFDCARAFPAGHPANNTAAAGARSTYPDIYLAQRTKDLPVGPASFTLSPANR
jgi:hypothetical protein